MTPAPVSDRRASARIGECSEPARALPAGSGAGEILADGSVDDVAGIGLVASVEPGVVFSSLAARCVPDLCDVCAIDIVDGPRARYRIVYPQPQTAGRDLVRLADRDRAAPDHRARVAFAHPRPADTSRAEDQDEHRSAGRDEFHGVATFVWQRRTPTDADRTMAAVLIDHAVHTVVWQRSERAADAATEHAAHLRVALQTSRHIGTAIGILMNQHKITQDRAFDLLRAVSQRSHRKLRELALDVVDTGWLDPALLTGPRQDSQISRLSPDRAADPGQDPVEVRHD